MEARGHSWCRCVVAGGVVIMGHRSHLFVAVCCHLSLWVMCHGPCFPCEKRGGGRGVMGLTCMNSDDASSLFR